MASTLRPAFREDQVGIIVSFIRHHLEDSGRAGLVLGMSGGVDSSLVAKLCADAVGSNRVLGMWLGEGSPEGEDYRDARNWARALGIPFRPIDISPLVNSFAHLLEQSRRDRVALGNLKARIRMTVLYDTARAENRLVIGTGNKSELLTGYFCYDQQTRAMTPEGPKFFSEMRPGTIVFSMDLETRKILEVPVDAVHVFDYVGDMIEIRTRRLDLLVTPNHRLLVRRKHGYGRVGFVSAESRLTAGQVLIPTPEPWDGNAEAPNVIHSSGFLGTTKLAWNANPPVEMRTGDFLYLLGLFIGDGVASLGRVVQRVTGLAPQERIEFREPDGRFAALEDFPRLERTYAAPRIFIASTAGKRSRGPLEAILDRYGIHGTRRPTFVSFTNRALWAAFALCGTGARNKGIPGWVLKWPARTLRDLYRGLMDSDGNADGHAYTTTSERLAHQMVELCAKLGLHAWISRRPPKTTYYKGKEIRSAGYFNVRISPTARTLSFGARNMRRVPYIGKVWCPTVPPNENLLVERHGRTAFCGNTKFGDGGADFLPIGDLYKTQVREIAKFLGLPKRIIGKVPTAGLWAGQTDEAELALTYEVLDRVLLGLELRMSREDIAERADVTQATVEHVERLYRASVHKRKPPLIPKVGIRTIGIDWRE